MYSTRRTSLDGEAGGRPWDGRSLQDGFPLYSLLRCTCQPPAYANGEHRWEAKLKKSGAWDLPWRWQVPDEQTRSEMDKPEELSPLQWALATLGSRMALEGHRATGGASERRLKRNPGAILCDCRALWASGGSNARERRSICAATLRVIELWSVLVFLFASPHC